MPYSSGFFDAMDTGGGLYDRAYQANDFAHFFELLVKNGVFPQPSNGMSVSAETPAKMSVAVNPGTAWINGHFITIPNNGTEHLDVPVANPSLPRIDSVVVGLNAANREITIYIRSGIAGASPSPVLLLRNSDVYELELAQITVSAGVASISQSAIRDTRSDSSRCGIVTGLIEQLDVTGFFQQAQASFDLWFEDIKTQLSDDVAGSLQNQINDINDPNKVGTVSYKIAELKRDKLDISQKATISEAQIATNDIKYVTPSKVKSYMDYIKATEAEAIQGISTTKWVSPATAGIVAKARAFSVGDTLDTMRNSLGSNWALCNGDSFDPAQYPDLAAVTPGMETMLGLSAVDSTNYSFDGFLNANGYQIGITAAGSVIVTVSRDSFKTKTSKTLDSVSYVTRGAIFYANGYYIAVWTHSTGTPGSLQVSYATDPFGTWTRDVSGSDVYGQGFFTFYDMVYYGGKYYLTASGSGSTDTGNKMLYSIVSTTPAFLKANTTVTKIAETYNGFFTSCVKANNMLVVFGQDSGGLKICRANRTSPGSFMQTSATLPSSNNMSWHGETIFYHNGTYAFFVLDYSYNHWKMYYTTSIDASSWTEMITPTTVGGSADAYVPRTPFIYTRGVYMFPIQYASAVSSGYSSGFYITPNFKSPSGWSFVDTRKDNAAPWNFNGAPLTNSEVWEADNWINMIVTGKVLKIPPYAVPRVDIAPLYKYIKVKEGL